MPRKMRKAPDNVILARTNHHTWIACEEVWGEQGELLNLRPLRQSNGEITQRRERAQMLAEVERAMLESKLRQTERRLRDLQDGPGPIRLRSVGPG